MRKNKKTKEDQALKEENLNDVSGGGKAKINETNYNRETIGNYNVIGNNADYQQMLGFVDKLDSSGKLDYLKRK